VNLTVLRELGELLIDIHSQHATLEINNETFQLLVVDSIAANDLLLKNYQDNFRQFKSVNQKLKTLEERSHQAKADADYYQFQYNELDEASLHDEQEQETLEQELNALTHAEEIKKSLLTAGAALTEDDQSAVILLKEALLQLQHAEKYLPEAHELAERLNSTLIEIRDIAAEVEVLVGKEIWLDMSDLMLSISLESSPPDATLFIGAGSWPLLAENKNCILFLPEEPSDSSSSNSFSIFKIALGIPTSVSISRIRLSHHNGAPGRGNAGYCNHSPSSNCQ